MTQEYAERYVEAKKQIRENFPEKFIWVDEGDKVRTPKGEGIVSTLIYNPVRDSYFIEVTIGATAYFTTDPHELVMIEPREDRKGLCPPS